MEGKMIPRHILMNANGQPISPSMISKEIDRFGDGYNEATRVIITNSRVLAEDGEKFIECASRLLSSFKMTRRGPFHAKNLEVNLRRCWNEVGADLLEINNSVISSGFPRDRYLLGLNDIEREELIVKIWIITKKILPITMSKTSYGLVGASKILFSVLPEIALPVDNTQWLYVFKTVDFGDVLRFMISDIQKWEGITGMQLNELDKSKRLTTLPSIYNVMAMYARPKIK